MIIVNGQTVAMGKQFAISDEVEVITAVVDLESVRSFRGRMISRGMQASYERAMKSQTQSKDSGYARVHVDFALSDLSTSAATSPALSLPISTAFCMPEQEIAQGPACWLWDYLRRSGLAGFFLPLSGGIDSASTALIVYSMCRMIVEAVKRHGLFLVRCLVIS